MRFVAAGVAVLVLAACPPAPSMPQTGCRPATCSGCCDSAGTCQLGLGESACGRGGESCTPCGSGMRCSAGRCTGGTAGGSSTGTGQAELVSGSRLKAIHLTSGDGAKAPLSFGFTYGGGLFWDEQLSLYCTPFPFYGFFQRPAICLPIEWASEVTDPVYYSDAACTAAAPGASSTAVSGFFLDAGLPAATLYFAAADGGIFTAVQGGPAYVKLADGGCEPSGSTYTRGMPQSYAIFAPMQITRD